MPHRRVAPVAVSAAQREAVLEELSSALERSRAVVARSRELAAEIDRVLSTLPMRR
jgi:hypothetical protein